MTPEHRAHFDFDISFANGGGIRGDGFRLDLPSHEQSTEEISALLVRHLGLALVAEVELRRLRIVEEPHRGSRGVDAAPRTETTVIDLTAPVEAAGVSGDAGTSLAVPRVGGRPDLRTLVDLPAEVFHLHDAWGPDRGGIRSVTLADRELRGAAVLLDTGGGRRAGGGSDARAPHLTEEAARFLVAAGARLVGMDTAGVDDADGGARRAWSLLLAAGVPVVERLIDLDAVPARRARFTAAPLAVPGPGPFAVRAFAVVRSSH